MQLRLAAAPREARELAREPARLPLGERVVECDEVAYLAHADRGEGLALDERDGVGPAHAERQGHRGSQHQPAHRRAHAAYARVEEVVEAERREAGSLLQTGDPLEELLVAGAVEGLADRVVRLARPREGLAEQRLRLLELRAIAQARSKAMLRAAPTSSPPPGLQGGVCGWTWVTP